MPQISHNKHKINNKIHKKELASRTKNTAVATRAPCITCTTLAGQAAKMSRMAAPVTPSQAKQNMCKQQQNNTIICRNPKIKRMLVV
jgi:hypothetical protein